MTKTEIAREVDRIGNARPFNDTCQSCWDMVAFIFRLIIIGEVMK